MNHILNDKHEHGSKLSTIGVVLLVSVVSFIVGAAVYSKGDKDDDLKTDHAHDVSVKQQVTRSADVQHPSQSVNVQHPSQSVNVQVVNNKTNNMLNKHNIARTEPQQMNNSVVTTRENKHTSYRQKIKRPRIFNGSTTYDHNVLANLRCEDSDSMYRDEHVYDIARYYVYLAYEESKHDYADIQAFRNRMYMLATQAFNEFVMYEKTGHNTSMRGGYIEAAHKSRMVVVKYMNRHRLIVLASLRRENNDELTKIAKAHDMQLTLREQLYKPSITLCVDLFFANVAYIALVEHQDCDDAYHTLSIQATADYISSALARVAYAPCAQDKIHLRSAHKRMSCLNKLAIYNAAYGLILEQSLTSVNKARIAQRLDQYAGHVQVLTHLCRTNGIAMVLAYHVLAGMTPEHYMNKLLHSSHDDHLTTREKFSNLQHKLETCVDKNQSNTTTLMLCEQAISAALQIETDGIYNTMLQLFKLMQSSQKSELSMLLLNILNNTVVTDANSTTTSILKHANRIEHNLCKSYITHYNLFADALNDNKVVYDEVDVALRVYLDEYGADMVNEIFEAFTQQKDHITERERNILSALNILDAVCYTHNIYALSTNDRDTTSLAGDIIALRVICSAADEYGKFLTR